MLLVLAPNTVNNPTAAATAVSDSLGTMLTQGPLQKQKRNASK